MRLRWLNSLLLLLGLASLSCKSDRQKPDYAAETQAMVQRLDSLVVNGDPNQLYHWNSELARLWEQKVRSGTNDQERINAWFEYCRQKLLSGDSRAAIQQLEAYLARFNQPYEQLLSENTKAIFELLALAYLRLGEQENCQQNHTPFHCILPLQTPALHQLTEGSESALALYSLLYSRFPEPETKWLLNLASMTLDRHSTGMASSQKIDFPNWQLEQQDFPRFGEVAMSLGVNQDGLSGGAITEDFNQDGFIDIFATSYGMRDPVKLFLNNGRGGFTDATANSGLEGIVSGLNCLQADYDNDGLVDILILRGGWLGQGGNQPNSLLKNLGNGRFADVTKSAGLLSWHPTQTATWADFDQDGWLDLFIGNESRQGEYHPCELYMNQGNGTFKEASIDRGLGSITAFVKGVVAGDINNDGWPDLYVSVLGGQNLLFKNQQGYFTELGRQAGVSEPFYSFPTWFWDVNNDGYQDIFVSGYDLRNLGGLAADYAAEMEGLQVSTEKPRLFINNGDETFTDQTRAYGLDKTMYAMGANFGDLDNDGFLDFYAGTGAPEFSTVVPNRMFRNVNGTHFEEVTSAGGFGHIQKGHGIAFADLDNDGDQDIYQVMGGAFEGDTFTNVLYENPIAHHNWVVIALEGDQTNKAAIGTRIELVLDNGQKLFRTVSSGGSFGASSLQQEIGLGQATRIAKLTVYWPQAKAQTFTDVEVNQKVLFKEGDKELVKVGYRPAPFTRSIAPMPN